ncbi:MAG: hypothetical protein ABL931_21845 [Usitatibacteraceae bacterium]
MTLFLIAAAAMLVAAFVFRQPGRLAELVPVCEIKDSVVLTVDGGLATGFLLEPLAYNSCSTSQVEHVAQSMSTLLRRLADGTVLQLIVDVQPGEPAAVRRISNPTMPFVGVAVPARVQRRRRSCTWSEDGHDF